MFDKLVFSHLFLIFCCLSLSGAKMCWEDCGGEIIPENVDLLHCRRRTTYPELEEFSCEGKLGPPCTLFKGDEVTVVVKWTNPGYTNLKHSIYWDTAFLPLPWPGLDREVCPYLDGDRGCHNTTVPGNLISKTRFNISITVQNQQI